MVQICQSPLQLVSGGATVVNVYVRGQGAASTTLRRVMRRGIIARAWRSEYLLRLAIRIPASFGDQNTCFVWQASFEERRGGEPHCSGAENTTYNKTNTTHTHKPSLYMTLSTGGRNLIGNPGPSQLARIWRQTQSEELCALTLWLWLLTKHRHLTKHRL